MGVGKTEKERRDGRGSLLGCAKDSLRVIWAVSALLAQTHSYIVTSPCPHA